MSKSVNDDSVCTSESDTTIKETNSEEARGDSFKTFSEIKSEFELFDALPPADPTNFNWDELSQTCFDTPKDDFKGPLGKHSVLLFL